MQYLFNLHCWLKSYKEGIFAGRGHTSNFTRNRKMIQLDIPVMSLTLFVFRFSCCSICCFISSFQKVKEVEMNFPELHAFVLTRTVRHLN
jgi:hypothetical protein